MNSERLERHILRWECSVIGLESESVESLFKKAARKGVINDPHDPGGDTFCGVTLSTYRDWCRRKGYPKPTVERLARIDYATSNPQPCVAIAPELALSTISVCHERFQ